MPLRTSEILQQQRCDFFEAYTRIRKEYSNEATRYPKQWLIHKTLNSQAPNTYISTEVAQRIIAQIEKGTYTPQRKDIIEERNQNFYKTYKELEEKAITNNEFIVKTMLVEEALLQPTPKFYISPRWASQVIFDFDRKGDTQ